MHSCCYLNVKLGCRHGLLHGAVVTGREVRIARIEGLRATALVLVPERLASKVHEPIADRVHVQRRHELTTALVEKECRRVSLDTASLVGLTVHEVADETTLEAGEARGSHVHR